MQVVVITDFTLFKQGTIGRLVCIDYVMSKRWLSVPLLEPQRAQMLKSDWSDDVHYFSITTPVISSCNEQTSKALVLVCYCFYSKSSHTETCIIKPDLKNIIFADAGNICCSAVIRLNIKASEWRTEIAWALKVCCNRNIHQFQRSVKQNSHYY